MSNVPYICMRCGKIVFDKKNRWIFDNCKCGGSLWKTELDYEDLVTLSKVIPTNTDDGLYVNYKLHESAEKLKQENVFDYEFKMMQFRNQFCDQLEGYSISKTRECPVCKKSISKNAETCVHCGYITLKKRIGGFCYIIFSVLGVTLFGSMAILNKKSIDKLDIIKEEVGNYIVSYMKEHTTSIETRIGNNGNWNDSVLANSDDEIQVKIITGLEDIKTEGSLTDEFVIYSDYIVKIKLPKYLYYVENSTTIDVLNSDIGISFNEKDLFDKGITINNMYSKRYIIQFTVRLDDEYEEKIIDDNDFKIKVR